LRAGGFTYFKSDADTFGINEHLEFFRRHRFPDQRIGNPEVMPIRSNSQSWRQRERRRTVEELHRFEQSIAVGITGENMVSRGEIESDWLEVGRMEGNPEYIGDGDHQRADADGDGMDGEEENSEQDEANFTINQLSADLRGDKTKHRENNNIECECSHGVRKARERRTQVADASESRLVELRLGAVSRDAFWNKSTFHLKSTEVNRRMVLTF
jgi:hypothetical protein